MRDDKLLCSTCRTVMSSPKRYCALPWECSCVPSSQVRSEVEPHRRDLRLPLPRVSVRHEGTLHPGSCQGGLAPCLSLCCQPTPQYSTVLGIAVQHCTAWCPIRESGAWHCGPAPCLRLCCRPAPQYHVQHSIGQCSVLYSTALCSIHTVNTLCTVQSSTQGNSFPGSRLW